jgi:hypothetical protein
MKLPRRNFLHLAAGAAALPAMPRVARAQAYPSRPVRMIVVTFSTCADSIRTVPFLQHDPDRPEDVMTDSEDHASERFRSTPRTSGRFRSILSLL